MASALVAAGVPAPRYAKVSDVEGAVDAAHDMGSMRFGGCFHCVTADVRRTGGLHSYF